MPMYLRWERIAYGKKLIDKHESFSISVSNAVQENKKIPQKTKNLLRIVSYNVHYWKDQYDKKDTQDQIFEIFRLLDADVLVLQEVSPEPGFGKGADFSGSNLEKRFKMFGYTYFASCNTLPTKTQWFGNVIASKIPFHGFSKVFTTQKGGAYEQRCFIKATDIYICNERLTILGTHLEVGDDAQESVRAAQVRELLDVARQTGQKNILIAADFNAIRKKDYAYSINKKKPWSLLADDYADYTGQTLPPSTAVMDTLARNNWRGSFGFIGWQGPRFTVWSGKVVDFVMLSPGWRLPIVGSYVYFSDESDHLPIIVDIMRG